MNANIKQSMAVYPSPVIIQNGAPRLPTFNENPRSQYGGFDRPWPGVWGYKIKRVTNSIDYRPGQALTKEQVQALIDTEWTVTVL